MTHEENLKKLLSLDNIEFFSHSLAKLEGFIHWVMGITFFLILLDVIIILFHFKKKETMKGFIKNATKTTAIAILIILVVNIIHSWALPFSYFDDYIEQKDTEIISVTNYRFPAYRAEKKNDDIKIGYFNTPTNQHYVILKTTDEETYSGEIAIEIHQEPIEPYLEFKKTDVVFRDYDKEVLINPILHVWQKP